MLKDYSEWFKLKPKINTKKQDRDLYFKEGQIWWCSLGFNIDIEIDGKNEMFTRPVLILKIFSRRHVWVVPITSKGGFDKYYFRIDLFGTESFLVLSQLRTISSLRLLRKFSYLPEDQYLKAIDSIKKLF